jgi:uracil-DNA glycosylase
MKLPDNSWSDPLSSYWNSPEMKALRLFVQNEKAAGKVIFPREDHIFCALELTPLENVRVVILGQDPYHGEGQAQGLAFSVPSSIKIPPSLRNIYKELSDDLGLNLPMSGDLTPWAKEGVLLLNTCLTVEEGKAGSHQGRGWEGFTDLILKVINEQKENVVFILWGAPAQKKAYLINESRHLILSAPHPSPLSSYRGFFGSKPFSKTNDYLRSKRLDEVDWKLA